MSTYEWLSIAGVAGGLLVNLAVLYVLVAQLGAVRDQLMQARRATSAEHHRRRREATIDFYIATMRRRQELRDYLADDRDPEAVAQLIDHVRSDGIDSDRGHAVREYLNMWESLAVGVVTDVYDLEIVDALTGGRVIAISENYKPFIEWRREEIQQGDEDQLYKALKQVATLVRLERGSPVNDA